MHFNTSDFVLCLLSEHTAQRSTHTLMAERKEMCELRTRKAQSVAATPAAGVCGLRERVGKREGSVSGWPWLPMESLEMAEFQQLMRLDATMKRWAHALKCFFCRPEDRLYANLRNHIEMDGMHLRMVLDRWDRSAGALFGDPWFPPRVRDKISGFCTVCGISRSPLTRSYR